MGKTDPTADHHRQQSMILVQRDTPGLEIRRGMEVFGYDDHEHGGHAELSFIDVRVPASNLIGEEGSGFAIAQARLRPGRIHHCMRAIGVAERALEGMCTRAQERVAFGKQLAQQGVIRDWIAESRVRIEQLRLLVLKTAWLMDTVGNKGAHTEIQAIKIATPATVQWILDKAIQIHGAAGLSQDFDLAAAYAGTRTLCLADGPDEVQMNALGPRRTHAPASQTPSTELRFAANYVTAGDPRTTNLGDHPGARTYGWVRTFFMVRLSSNVAVVSPVPSHQQDTGSDAVAVFRMPSQAHQPPATGHATPRPSGCSARASSHMPLT
jgi:hypothetical protein